MNVYRFNEEIRNLLSRIDCDEAVTDEDIKALNKLTEDANSWVNTLFKLIRTANTNSTALKNEADYILRKGRRWDAAKEKFREILKEFLQNVLHTNRIQTELCSVSVCNNPARIVVDKDFDIRELIGTEFEGLVEVTYALNGSKAKQILSVGGKLPESIRLVAEGTHVRI